MPLPRIRLYQSALHGVTYVYGAPVRFSRDPEVLAERDAAKFTSWNSALLRYEREQSPRCRSSAGRATLS